MVAINRIDFKKNNPAPEAPEMTELELAKHIMTETFKKFDEFPNLNQNVFLLMLGKSCINGLKDRKDMNSLCELDDKAWDTIINL